MKETLKEYPLTSKVVLTALLIIGVFGMFALVFAYPDVAFFVVVAIALLLLGSFILAMFWSAASDLYSWLVMKEEKHESGDFYR